jgi:RimJ/RimL family protein N-acetyltransferase
VPDIPIIETDRLRLRGYRPSDLDDCVALWTHLDVLRYTTRRPQTREEIWGRILRYIGHWAVAGYGLWAAEDKESGRLIGDVGFADFKRDITPSLGTAPEAAWVLAPWAHGRGFATEAVRAMHTWLGPKRTVCIIDPGNTASIRVAEKAGYRELLRTTYKDEPMIVFERGI